MFTYTDYPVRKKSLEKFWYYMAIERDSQETVGSASLAFDRSASGDPEEDLYYVGMYFVRPDWRNSGLGTVLFDKVMEIAGDRNTVLNGVLRMTSRFANKYGFDKISTYTHNLLVIPTENMVIPIGNPQYSIKDIKQVEEKDVVAYDISITGRSRASYLLNFMTTGACFTKVALDYTGKVVGFGCVRIAYSNNLSAGPFYAGNEAIARSLFAAIFSSIPHLEMHKIFGCYYPSINEDASRLFNSLGGGHMQFRPFTQCQFTKKIIPTNDVKVYAVTELSCSIV